MAKQQNIFLIGLMGVGKTTIGRYLAKKLHLTFYDSDHEVERRTGADIPWIFDIEGEAGFREREHQVIDELTQMHGIILATGGGVIVTPDNCRHLAGRGVVIYLRASINELAGRTSQGRNRPLLLNVDLSKTLEKLNAEREPLYESIADFTYDTETHSIKSVGDRIIKDLRNGGHFK